MAVKGTGEDFNQSMIDIYRNLAEHMPDDGMQVVMFTHQAVSVWADLTLILWAKRAYGNSKDGQLQQKQNQVDLRMEIM